MTKEDRNRADARFNKAARAANDAQSGKTERDAALKAVTDNMASEEKSPALADWLANQQSGGRRT
jgi:hypothetical protein